MFLASLAGAFLLDPYWVKAPEWWYFAPPAFEVSPVPVVLSWMAATDNRTVRWVIVGLLIRGLVVARLVDHVSWFGFI